LPISEPSKLTKLGSAVLVAAAGAEEDVAAGATWVVAGGIATEVTRS
jgi:hypothetical protein